MSARAWSRRPATTLQRKDRALLQSYTTESEIDLSKRRALGTIEAQVQSAQAYVVTLTKRKDEIRARVAALGDKPQPPGLEREVANVSEELQKQADLIATKRKEAAIVTARYDADKQRWRELRTIAEAEAANNPVLPRATTATGNSGASPPPRPASPPWHRSHQQQEIAGAICAAASRRAVPARSALFVGPYIRANPDRAVRLR